MTGKLNDREACEILDFFTDNDIDEYVVVGKSVKGLQIIANQLNGYRLGTYELYANGRVSYDSERNKFTTKIEKDKL